MIYSPVRAIEVRGSEINLNPQEGIFRRFLRSVEVVEKQQGVISSHDGTLTLENVVGDVYIPSSRSINISAYESHITGYYNCGTLCSDEHSTIALAIPKSIERSYGRTVSTAAGVAKDLALMATFSLVPFAVCNTVIDARPYWQHFCLLGSGTYVSFAAHNTRADITGFCVAAAIILGDEAREAVQSISNALSHLGFDDVLKTAEYLTAWKCGGILRQYHTATRSPP